MNQANVAMYEVMEYKQKVRLNVNHSNTNDYLKLATESVW